MINNTIAESDTLQLPKDTSTLFDSIGTEKLYPKNTTIYHQGEKAEHFYFLKKGSVKIFFNSIEGLQKTISIVNDGSVLGEAAFFDHKPRISSAQTITPSTIISVTQKQMESAFAKDPKLAMYLLKVQAQSIRMLSAQVSGMAFSKADCRIANQLLQSQVKNAQVKNEKHPTVHLTHEEIGNLVGVSRVTVSKILNDFADKRIIKTAYRYIILTDIKKLEEIASVNL